MKTSAIMLQAMKNRETFQPVIYGDQGNDKTTGKPIGRLTVGYGHALTAADQKSGIYNNGISLTDAEALFSKDVKTKAEGPVNSLVHVSLTQNQFDALVSFVFNVGSGAFAGSGVLGEINAGRFDNVPAEIEKYNKEKNPAYPKDPNAPKLIFSKGLADRRRVEAGWFSRPSWLGPPTAITLTPPAFPSTVGGVGLGALTAPTLTLPEVTAPPFQSTGPEPWTPGQPPWLTGALVGSLSAPEIPSGDGLGPLSLTPPALLSGSDVGAPLWTAIPWKRAGLGGRTRLRNAPISANDASGLAA